jgi:hypothetical protein
MHSGRESALRLIGSRRGQGSPIGRQPSILFKNPPAHHQASGRSSSDATCSRSVWVHRGPRLESGPLYRDANRGRHAAAYDPVHTRLATTRSGTQSDHLAFGYITEIRTRAQVDRRRIFWVLRQQKSEIKELEIAPLSPFGSLQSRRCARQHAPARSSARFTSSKYGFQDWRAGRRELYKRKYSTAGSGSNR